MSAVYSNYQPKCGNYLEYQCDNTFILPKKTFVLFHHGIKEEDITSEMLMMDGREREIRIFALFSAIEVLQYELQQAHNAVAKDTGFMKGLHIVGIEIGFLSLAFLLGPVEIVARSVQALGMFVFGALHIATLCITSNDFDDDADDSIRDYFLKPSLGVAATALNMAQAAVSGFYTHIAHSGEEIDNQGQALCYLFCKAPEVETA